MTTGEWGTLNIKGAVTMKGSSKFVLYHSADAAQSGTLSMTDSEISLGTGSSLQFQVSPYFKRL